jgi:hypothetical protein
VGRRGIRPSVTFADYAALAPAATVTSVRMYTCPIDPHTIEPVRHAVLPPVRPS